MVTLSCGEKLKKWGLFSIEEGGSDQSSITEKLVTEKDGGAPFTREQGDGAGGYGNDVASGKIGCRKNVLHH